VVIDGNPLADIRQSDRIAQVMQNGRLFDARTLDEVAPRRVKRAPLFFQGADGASMPINIEALQAGHGHDED
jgi:hypothetical protein